MTRPAVFDAPRLALLLGLLFGGPAGCGRTPDPGSTAPADDELPSTAVTQFADGLELFLEHPSAVAGTGTKFNVHLTVLADGAPIRSGRLRLVATGPTGQRAEAEQPAPRSPGIFGPTLVFPEPGTNQLELILDSEQARGTLVVPVEVFADEPAARIAAANAGDEAEVPGTVPFLKEQAWKIGVRTEPVGRHDLVEHLDVPARITAAAGAEAVISTPIAGRVLPPAGGAFPRVGQRVSAGQIVALVEPPLNGPQGVQFLATQAQVRTLQAELQARLSAVDVEIARARLELDLARRVFERSRNLAASDAVARRQLEEDENRYLLAEEAHRGKLRLREPLEQTLRSVGQLLGPAGEPGTPSPGNDPTAGWQAAQVALRAPHAGTVTAARAVQGEFVDGSHPLFTVIDLDRVWVEARVSEFDLDRVVAAPAADLAVAAHPDRTFALLGQGGGTLIEVGSVVDPDSRTVPVRYEIPNPEPALRIGLLAEVAIETGVARGVVAIPESAIVEEEGRPIAYVLLDGEHFQKRDLRLGLKGHGLVEVKSGLAPGERVVVSGAAAIRLSTVTGVIPTHGHTH